jgi:hypothetical protein
MTGALRMAWRIAPAPFQCSATDHIVLVNAAEVLGMPCVWSRCLTTRPVARLHSAGLARTSITPAALPVAVCAWTCARHPAGRRRVTARNAGRENG